MIMDETKAEEIVFKMKTLDAEFQKMTRMVKDASEAFEAYQETIDKLESQFRLFRAMYWKLKDDLKPIAAGPISVPPDAPPSVKG